MSIYKEIIQNVINIYDDTPHPNKKCQDTKEDWMKYCFTTSYKKHTNFEFYKGSETCNNLFNDYYKCYVDDKKIKLNKKQ
jgi:hypothetical protein